MRSTPTQSKRGRPRVLIVDDDPSVVRLISTILRERNFELESAHGGLEALRKVGGGFVPQVVLLDVKMPDQNGIETLKNLAEIAPGAKVVMVSSVGDARSVVEAMRLGAQDYITKPFQPEALLATVDRVVGVEGQEGTSSAVLMDVIDEDTCMVTASGVMERLRERALLVAGKTIPVLISGESGTGKEVLARFIHSRSPRAAKPFLKVNCAALPADLLESELFGYEQGAFTGATSAKPGRFEQCDKGTILLDEVGEIPFSLQAKLLQVLHDGSFSRLGSRREVKVDVRIMAATNINIQEALAARTLREDLYYRLNGITLEVPPLRERREEIPVLLRHLGVRYAERYASPPFVPSQRLIDACMNHGWPGNVRELANLVKRALVLRDESALLEEMRKSAERAGAKDTDADRPKKARRRTTAAGKMAL